MHTVQSKKPHERLRSLIDEHWAGSDREFAEAVGISPVTLSRLVKGRSELRKSPNLAAIAEKLGITEEELLGGTPAGSYEIFSMINEFGGEPLMDDVEAILSWVPENMSARWTGEVSKLDRLAEVYAYGSRAGWSADRLDFVHKTRQRLEAIQRRSNS